MANVASKPSGGIPARKSALWMLGRILQDHKLIAELVGQGGLDRLDPADRARAQRLATDTLRHLQSADALIKRHVQKTPPVEVLNVLRLGAVELAQGASAHGVVNDLVSIVGKSKRHNRLKGLVNAVLRKLADHAAQDWNTQPTPTLPQWLRGTLTQAWGAEAMAKMEAVYAKSPPVDITLKSATAQRPEGAVELPTGSLRLSAPGQISALAGYETGDWWVQDAAAAIPARLIDGHTVLDLCAAPGGKTLQLAAMGKAVTAVDISETRANRLHENLARTGLTAEVVISSALSMTGHWDAVLLDAPCSATGTLRRHPDLPYAKDGSEFGMLIAQQSEMLDHAISLVRPGGQIVFCTCSLLPDEGEVQIEEALERHPGLSIDHAALDQPWIDPAWRSEEGGLRLRPDMWADLGGMDGFYIAALRVAG